MIIQYVIYESAFTYHLEIVISLRNKETRNGFSNIQWLVVVGLYGREWVGVCCVSSE